MMHRIPTTLALITVAASSASAVTLYSDPAPFNRPGFTNTEPWDVNDSNVIVGSSDGVGFIYSGGAFSTFVHPDVTTGFTTVTGIANDDTLVGGYVADENSPVLSFIFDGSTFTPIAVPFAANTFARRISANGRYITGDWWGEAGGDPGAGSGSFVLDRQDDSFFYIPNTPDYWTITQGVNNQGQVTGSFDRVNPATEWESGAFLLDLATTTTTEYLDVGGWPFPSFRDINEQGTIAGWGEDGLGSGFGCDFGFVGMPGQWQLFLPSSDSICILAYGLNNTGTLVGFYEGDVVTGWIATALPTPIPAFGPLGLAVPGTGALAGRVRRRAQRRS